MRETPRTFVPRTIDRTMFHILAALHVVSGVYVVGPWYVEEGISKKAILYEIFDSDFAVNTYGVLLVMSGLLLFYAAASDHTHRLYTRILEWALLSGFLIRLYAFAGSVIILNSWKPPNYISSAATVVMLGAYWVWVRVDGSAIQ